MAHDTDPRTMKSLNLQELRVILSDEIDRIRAGKSTAAQANAVSNAAGKIMSSVRLELEYARLKGKAPIVPILEEGAGHGVE